MTTLITGLIFITIFIIVIAAVWSSYTESIPEKNFCRDCVHLHNSSTEDNQLCSVFRDAVTGRPRRCQEVRSYCCRGRHFKNGVKK